MKRWRNVIILAVICAVLLVAYFVLKDVGSDESGSASEDSTEQVKLIDFEKDDINKIVINYGDEQFTFVLEERQVEAESDDDDDSTTTRTEKVWVCDDFEPDQSVLDDVAYGGANAKTKRLIDSDPQDLSLYGLDNPVSVTFYNKSGESRTIEVGNPTPTEDYYYVKRGDGKEVYTLASNLAEYLSPGKYDLISKKLYDEDNLKDTDISELAFYRDGELVFSAHRKEADSADWLITEPMEISGNAETLYNFLTTLSGLKARDIVGEVSSSDLQEYGLDNPKYVFRYTLAGRSYELMLGNKNGSAYYYALMDGYDYIFTVSSGNFDFLDVRLEDVAMRTVFVPAIYDVSRLVIELDGRTDVLEMDVKKDDSENNVYIFNRQKLEDEDDQSLFRKYYQAAVAIYGDKIDLDASPEGKAEVRLTYTFKSGEVTVIELIPTPDGYGYYAMKNGSYTGLIVPKRVLDKESMGLRTAYRNLIEGLNN
jgi:hypothetical protein